MKSRVTVRSPTLNDNDASCVPHPINTYRVNGWEKPYVEMGNGSLDEQDNIP